MIDTIAHPTDLSDTSALAFAHALRLTLVTRARLCLMHVKGRGSEDAWPSFPHVRATLARWGFMDADEPPARIEAKLGVKVVKVEIEHADPTSGLFEFLLSHRPDLMVLATHGRDGLTRWLAGSVSEEIARRTHVPSLLVGPEAHGFVDPETGDMRLGRILVPVAHLPAPDQALSALARLLEALDVPLSALEFLHVGEVPPPIPLLAGDEPAVTLATGPVVETILAAAEQRRPDLIVMPTAGHKGVLDVLRGSTTERVLRHARAPLLALHAP